jgi:hypothetical protein
MKIISKGRQIFPVLKENRVDPFRFISSTILDGVVFNSLKTLVIIALMLTVALTL